MKHFYKTSEYESLIEITKSGVQKTHKHVKVQLLSGPMPPIEEIADMADCRARYFGFRDVPDNYKDLKEFKFIVHTD